MELFRLLGTIAIDNSGANGALDDTTDRAEKSEGKISKAFKKIGAVVATVFAVDKIVAFGKACVDVAAEMNATASQFSQVFGDLEESAANSLSNIADETGVVENRMRASYTKIAAFAKTSGMDTAESLDLANRSMIAIADSAAFYDRTLEETTESLQSFLKGNYENDSALGLSCTETTRNAAANKLYGKSFKELSEQQKQLTLLQMVEDANELSGAMGQASRESNTWTNQTGNLKQAWADLQGTLGQTILPVVTNLVGSLADKLVIITDKVGGFINQMSDAETRTQFVKTALESAFGAEAVATMTATFQSIQEALAPLWQAFQNLGGVIASDAAGSTFFQDAFSVMATAISQAWATIGQPVFDAITAGINWLAGNWPIISEGISSYFQLMCDYFTTAWTTIGQPVFDAIWSAVGWVAGYFSEKMPEIMAFVQTAVAGIQDTWQNHLKPCFEAIGGFLNTYLLPTFQFVFDTFIKPLIDSTFGFIVDLWNNTLKPVLDGICDFLTGVFTGDWQKMADSIVQISNGLDAITVSIFNGIKRFLKGIWDNVGTEAVNSWNKIKNNLTTKVKQIENTVKNTFERIRSNIATKINFAKDTVKNAIDKIKGFFNFSWSLPSLKLPHPWISGRFSLDPPQVPSFGISWYKKAMNDPIIMNSPTAFGINNLGEIMAGGEAGSEVVSGTDTLMNMISEAVASKNARLEGILTNILAFLMEYMPQMANMQMVTDTGVLIGELAPGINEKLGDYEELNKKGVW